eukprot:779810-Alexandrium_andersonii.AAC.1
MEHPVASTSVSRATAMVGCCRPLARSRRSGLTSWAADGSKIGRCHPVGSLRGRCPGRAETRPAAGSRCGLFVVRL